MNNNFDYVPTSSSEKKPQSEYERRRAEIIEATPWLEAYEVDALLADEGLSPSQESSAIVAGRYQAISADTSGQYGAYSFEDTVQPPQEQTQQASAEQTESAETDGAESAPVADSEQAQQVRERARELMKKNIQTEASKMGLALLVYVFAQFVICAGVAAYLFLILNWKLDDFNAFLTEPKNMLLLQGVLLIVGLGVPFLVYIYLFRLPLAEMVPFHKLRRGELFPSVCFGLGVCSLVHYICNIADGGTLLTGSFYNYNQLTVSSDLLDVVYSLICLCIIPVVLEEFVFRGIILQVFRRRGGDTFALIVSSALCALIYSSQHGFGIFCISLALGYMCIFSGSLMPSLIVSLVHNILSLGLTFVANSIPANIVTYIDIGLTFVCLMLALLTMPRMLSKFPDFFKLRKSDTSMTLKEKLVACFTRPSIIILIITSVILFITDAVPVSTLLELF